MRNFVLRVIGVFVVIDIAMRNLSWKTIKQLYGSVVNDFSIRYGAVNDYIIAMIQIESGGNPFAIGGTSDFGLLQITQPALTDFNKRFGVSWTLFDIWIDPRRNIQVGTWYLSWLQEQFNNDMRLAVSAYNQGIGNVKANTFKLDYWNKVNAVYQEITGVV